MRNILMWLCMLAAVFAAACIEDDERCGGLVWDPSSLTCKPRPEPVDTNPVDTGVPTDGDSDTDTNPKVPILGESCNTDADCAKYHTDYCLIITEGGAGTCTLRNCSAAPDNCPVGYNCCIAGGDAFYPTHCMTADIFAQSGGMLCDN